MGKLRVAGFAKESIVDGPGLRYVVFTQGCPHNCYGCHNPQTHDFNGGYFADVDDIYNDIVKNPLLKGVTISGGEPFNQACEVSNLLTRLREKNYDVMVYTGYRYEDLHEKANDRNEFLRLIENTDILVDGKFEMESKNEMLSFRGSENQRIIDCKKSMDAGEVITVEI